MILHFSPILKFNVFGHSMEPLFPQGSIILVSSIPYFFSSPKVRDVIVYKEKRSDTYFVKRITSVEKGTYFVEGDNKKDSLDSRKLGRIKKKDIIGKVVFKL